MPKLPLTLAAFFESPADCTLRQEQMAAKAQVAQTQQAAKAEIDALMRADLEALTQKRVLTADLAFRRARDQALAEGMRAAHEARIAILNRVATDLLIAEQQMQDQLSGQDLPPDAVQEAIAMTRDLTDLTLTRINELNRQTGRISLDRLARFLSPPR